MGTAAASLVTAHLSASSGMVARFKVTGGVTGGVTGFFAFPKHFYTDSEHYITGVKTKHETNLEDLELPAEQRYLVILLEDVEKVVISACVDIKTGAELEAAAKGGTAIGFEDRGHGRGRGSISGGNAFHWRGLCGRSDLGWGFFDGGG